MAQHRRRFIVVTLSLIAVTTLGGGVSAHKRITRDARTIPHWVRFPFEFQLCGISLGTRAVDRDANNNITRYTLFLVHGNPTAVVLSDLNVITAAQQPPGVAAFLSQAEPQGIPTWALATAVQLDANHVEWVYLRDGFTMGFVVDRLGFVDAIVVAGLESPIAKTQMGDPEHTIQLGDDLRKVLFRYGYPDAIEPGPIGGGETGGGLPGGAGMPGMSGMPGMGGAPSGGGMGMGGGGALPPPPGFRGSMFQSPNRQGQYAMLTNVNYHTTPPVIRDPRHVKQMLDRELRLSASNTPTAQKTSYGTNTQKRFYQAGLGMIGMPGMGGVGMGGGPGMPSIPGMGGGPGMGLPGGAGEEGGAPGVGGAGAAGAGPAGYRTFQLRYDESYNIIFTIRNNRVIRIYIWGDPDYFTDEQRGTMRTRY